MKKILTALIITHFSLNNVAFSADFYYSGIEAYNKGELDKATQNFQKVIKVNPRNVNARYYLSQISIKQNRISEAIDQYNRIILIAPKSKAGELSQKGLSLIKYSTENRVNTTKYDELDKYKDNYFDYVLTDNGEISKWQSFPINVFIEPKKQKESVKKAFEQWQTRSNNLAEFNFINSPENAKISVKFKDKLESTSTGEKFFAGFSKPSYEGKYLSKSEITILTVDPSSKTDLENSQILATALHEIGHSLGFNGHSPNQNDVMYASSTEPKIELTKRDLNTLNLLYKTASNKLAAKKIGNTDIKLKQAQDYIKTSPEKFIGWSNLGDIYFNKKMYPEAIKNYKKAIAIEPDRASIHASIGTAYRLSQDKQNAYLSIKKACELEPSNTDYATLFKQICKELGRKE